jgi:hypothetical protein
MLAPNRQLGSTDLGTSFPDIIMNNVCAVSDGQITGFQAFLHDPKSLKETVDQIGKMSIPKRFIEAVTARRVATNAINSTWRCPLNLQTPLTCPMPWTVIEANQNSATETTVEYQIMRTIDFIGRNYIRIELPTVDTTQITMGTGINGGPNMQDPTQMFLGAWHRDLVPRIISEVAFYPRSCQHKLFVYTGYDIAVHNIIFGNANKEMNDLMAGEDKFELGYDPYRVDGTALGQASFKGIDVYQEYTPVSTNMNQTQYVRVPKIDNVPDGFTDYFQIDVSMDLAEFQNTYRRNVWYEAPVAIPYDCRHSIHSRRFVHQKSVIIIPLDVLPFGYSIESSLPTAALAGDCGYISITRHSNWFDRSFYLTRLSDIPSIHPIAQHKHYVNGDVVEATVPTQNGTLIKSGFTKIDSSDERIGWVNPRTVQQFGNPEFSTQVGSEDEQMLGNIRQEGAVIGKPINEMEGVIPMNNKPKFNNLSETSAGYYNQAQAFGGKTNKQFYNQANTYNQINNGSLLSFEEAGKELLLVPSKVNSQWAQIIALQINIKLLQVGYVTMPAIKQLLTKLPNIYLTTEWADSDVNITQQQFNINNDLYIMALLFWFIPEDSFGIESLRMYPHQKNNTEAPVIAGLHMQNEQSQGKILYSWDMLNLQTPAHMGLKPLLSNMGIVSFTPMMIPNQMPYAIYDQNLSGYITCKFENPESTTGHNDFINMRRGKLKVISIGINGTALVNLSLFRLVF